MTPSSPLFLLLLRVLGVRSAAMAMEASLGGRIRGTGSGDEGIRAEWDGHSLPLDIVPDSQLPLDSWIATPSGHPYTEIRLTLNRPFGQTYAPRSIFLSFTEVT